MRTTPLCPLVAVAVLAVLPAPGAAQVAPRYGSVFDGSAVEKLAEGIYAFVAPDSRTAYFNGNTLVVVGDDGVLVVDSGDALTATRKTIAEIKRLTPLPVRFLVNTHWHWDHALGNGEYPRRVPWRDDRRHRRDARTDGHEGPGQPGRQHHGHSTVSRFHASDTRFRDPPRRHAAHAGGSRVASRHNSTISGEDCSSTRRPGSRCRMSPSTAN